MKKAKGFLLMVFAVLLQLVFFGNAMAAGVDLPESLDLSSFFVPGIIIVVVIAILIAISLFLRNYIKVPTNKVAVLTGRRRKLSDGSVVGFRIVKGGAVFKWPILESVSYLDLNVITLEVQTLGAVTKEGVPVDVQAVANVKVGGDDVYIGNAAEALLGKGDEEVRNTVVLTLAAHLRTICGTLTVEAINADRQAFSQKVTSESESELKRLGISVIGLTVQHISDNLGYITALGVKRTAEVKRDADIGTAEARRDQEIKTAQAKQESVMKSTDADRAGAVQAAKNQEAIAQANRDLAVKTAELKAQQAEAEAKRDQAGPRAKAIAEKDVLVAQVAAEKAQVEAQTELEQKKAVRKEQELVVTQIKPAEAAKQQAVIDAEAAKLRLVITAGAAKEKLVIEAGAAREKAVIDAEAAQQKLVIEAEAEKKAEVTKAEGYQRATVTRAQADRDATIAKAEAEKATFMNEGEGEAAKIRALGEAEAAKTRAVLVAEAEGEAAKVLQLGKAEGEAIRAKLLAEAEGTLKKAEALRALEDSAKLMFILERAPDIIEAIGEAAAKALTPAFQSVGQGLANIDKVTIVDTGSGDNKGGGLAKFAGTAPNLFFTVIQQARSLGLDVSGLLKKLGLDVVDDVGLAKVLKTGDAPAAPELPKQ